MKKVLKLTAAGTLLAASLAAPAMAGTGTADAHWHIAAHAAPFCQLGAASTASSTNTSVTSPNSFVITNFQNPGADTQNNWGLYLHMANSVCNYKFDVTAQSLNGGLKYTGSNTTTDPSFTTLLNYDVGFNVGSAWNDQNINGRQTGWTLQEDQPSAGTFTLLFRSVNSTANLLAGNYADTMTVTLSPAA